MGCLLALEVSLVCAEIRDVLKLGANDADPPDDDCFLM